MDKSGADSPRVFISYSHEPPATRARVLELADALRSTGGVDAWIDRYVDAPPEGWIKWMEDQLSKAEFVLLVCTPEYSAKWNGSTGGVLYEATIIQNTLALRNNGKYIPILLDDVAGHDIPTILLAYAHYSWPSEFDSLVRRLWKVPTVDIPAVGQRPTFRPLRELVVRSEGAHPVHVSSDGLPTVRNPPQKNDEQAGETAGRSWLSRGLGVALSRVRRAVTWRHLLSGVGLVGLLTAAAFVYQTRPKRALAARAELEGQLRHVLDDVGTAHLQIGQDPALHQTLIAESYSLSSLVGCKLQIVVQRQQSSGYVTVGAWQTDTVTDTYTFDLTRVEIKSTLEGWPPPKLVPTSVAPIAFYSEPGFQVIQHSSRGRSESRTGITRIQEDANQRVLPLLYPSATVAGLALNAFRTAQQSCRGLQ